MELKKIIRDSLENEIGCYDTAKVVVKISDVNLSIGDLNENGTPDITDPCSCIDSRNIKESINGQTRVKLFHDVVNIQNGGIGQTWLLDTVNLGAILHKNGTPIPNNTPLTDFGNGNYRLDFWHRPDIGFNASFRRLSDNTVQTIGNSCQEQACLVIPIFSQWSLVIFGLLVLNISLFILLKIKDITY